MDRIKRSLTVLCIAGCAAGGGGGGGGTDTHDAGIDGKITDGQNPTIDGSMVDGGSDSCAGATTISIATAYSTIATTTTGANADLAAPCGTAGTPDVFFKFTLTRPELVYADTFGSSTPTTLYFASSCSTPRTSSTTTGDAVCSTGACGTSQSQVVALLDPGTHYLVLAGQGAATIHFQHAEVGSGSVDFLAAGSSTVTGTTASGTGLLYACDAGGGENAYWWRTCPADAGGAFLASTCDNTMFDTMMSLQMPGTDTTLCDDDSCSKQSSIGANIPAGAGLFVLAVDGFSTATHGNYTLFASRP